MFGAMDLGIADHGQRASREQAAQIAVALFADTAKLLLSPARDAAASSAAEWPSG
jgi:hypothetical protein